MLSGLRDLEKPVYRLQFEPIGLFFAWSHTHVISSISLQTITTYRYGFFFNFHLHMKRRMIPKNIYYIYRSMHGVRIVPSSSVLLLVR